jgi:GxxExxY protein
MAELIIVELKALNKLATREDAQLLNYLKATRYPLGVLINFGNPDELEWKRLVGDAPLHIGSTNPAAIFEKISAD